MSGWNRGGVMSPAPHCSIGTAYGELLYCTSSMLVCDITWAIEVVYCGEGEGQREKKESAKRKLQFLGVWRGGQGSFFSFLLCYACLFACLFMMVVEMAREKQLLNCRTIAECQPLLEAIVARWCC